MLNNRGKEMFKAWNHGKDIERIKRLIKGNEQWRIKNSFRKFKQEDLNELISIAHSQLKAVDLFEKGNRLMLNQEDLRFTTPEIIGNYRADRILRQLGKVKIADLCSGIGSQTISFAQKLKHVLSVEIDERKINYAFKNIKTYDIRNTTLVKGDIFSKEIIDKVSSFRPKVIFVDPQRKEKGERREEEDLIKRIVELYSKITPNLAIEVPPFLDIRELREELKDNKLDFNFEAEYLSVDFKLRRLTLYFSELREYDFRIVTLPEMKFLGLNTKSFDDDSKLKETNEISTYLIEPNPALTRASIIHEFTPKLKVLDKGHNTILTSHNLLNDEREKDFFQQYKVLFYKKSESYYDDEIINKLNEFKAKYVVIKQSIQPQEYWQVRRYYENKLVGAENKILYLFYLKNNIIIAELVQ